MDFFRLAHPDAITGHLSSALHRIAHASENTLAELDAYTAQPAARLFPAPTALPRAHVRQRWQLPGIVSEDIVFESLHEPLEPRFRERYAREYRENHTVYARRIRPSRSRGRPRLLYLHGYLQPETYLEELVLNARMARRLDVEIVQLQPPYHGRRTPRSARFGGEYYWTADLVRSVEALRQSVLDARTLLSWMLERDERPVGVSGLSLGGTLAAILTCVEPRFDFSIPLIAHMDVAALTFDAPVLELMRRELRSFGWGRDELSRFVTSLGWYHLRAVIPRDRILLHAASEDLFFDPEVLAKMWREWGEPAIHWYPCSHMGFAQHLSQVVERMRAFIDALPREPKANA